jgi:predicted nuclease of predicted toxin-antitoxin system
VRGFLFDENLPKVAGLHASKPVGHASAIALQASDEQLWVHAVRDELVIVTKDFDFSRRIIGTKPPPWVVHLRIGNLRRVELEAFLLGVWPRIEQLLPAHKLLNVFADRIESILA